MSDELRQIADGTPASGERGRPVRSFAGVGRAAQSGIRREPAPCSTREPSGLSRRAHAVGSPRRVEVSANPYTLTCCRPGGDARAVAWNSIHTGCWRRAGAIVGARGRGLVVRASTACAVRPRDAGARTMGVPRGAARTPRRDQLVGASPRARVTWRAPAPCFALAGAFAPPRSPPSHSRGWTSRHGPIAASADSPPRKGRIRPSSRGRARSVSKAPYRHVERESGAVLRCGRRGARRWHTCDELHYGDCEGGRRASLSLVGLALPSSGHGILNLRPPHALTVPPLVRPVPYTVMNPATSNGLPSASPPRVSNTPRNRRSNRARGGAHGDVFASRGSGETGIASPAQTLPSSCCPSPPACERTVSVVAASWPPRKACACVAIGILALAHSGCSRAAAACSYSSGQRARRDSVAGPSLCPTSCAPNLPPPTAARLGAAPLRAVKISRALVGDRGDAGVRGGGGAVDGVGDPVAGFREPPRAELRRVT